ncbi:MAG: hypothetical protein U0175_29800 [Caldilineaceae bacterium]
MPKTKLLAYERKVPYIDELDSLDRDDFLTYVSKCKGNLCYPDLANLDLPARLERFVSQADVQKLSLVS